MTLSWPDVSEIVGGLVIAGQIAENAVRPDQFSAPYNEVIKRYKNGTRNVETLIEMFGLSAISPLLEAPKQLPQTQVNWTSLLENACAAYQAGVDLEKLAKKMKQGDPVDLTQLTSIAMKAQSGQSSQLIPASKVEARKAVFMPSGWQPIDEHLGGLPESGLVVVGARPKTGKTWWALTLCYHFLKHYPGKKVAFFSAEMLNDEIRERLDHMDKKAPLPDELLDRFLISDDAFNTETIINRCATVDDLGLVVVDFADMVVKEISEPEYTALYMLLAKLAKQQRIPVILLAQLSGSYQGGLPRPHMLRWTRLAEALAWMVLMLWNPAKDTFADDPDSDNSLPIIKDHAYCIAWMVRGGYPCHPDDNPGAICIPFKGESWHPSRSKWFSLTKEERTEKRRMSRSKQD